MGLLIGIMSKSVTDNDREIVVNLLHAFVLFAGQLILDWSTGHPFLALYLIAHWHTSLSFATLL